MRPDVCTREDIPSDLKVSLRGDTLTLTFRTATVTLPADGWARIDAAVKEVLKSRRASLTAKRTGS